MHSMEVRNSPFLLTKYLALMGRESVHRSGSSEWPSSSPTWSPSPAAPWPPSSRRPNGSKSPLYCSLDRKLGREAG